MAVNVWNGHAQPVAQVVTITISGYHASTTYSITINSKTVSVAGTTDTAGTASALQVALAASTIPEFAEVTWTYPGSGAVVTGTAATPGVPFTATSSVSGGSGTIGAVTTTTANSGPNVYSATANWSLGYVPQATLAAPVQAAAAAASGGSLSNGTTYYWIITATTQTGETIKSNQQSLAITTPNLTATLSWAQVAGATGYKVYRSTTTDTYTTPALVTTITSGSTVTYNDTGTAVGAGAPPGVSTAVGDDVCLTNSASSILYDIDQSTLTVTSFSVDATYTGDIGLPRTNAAGGYVEYRTTSLKLGIPTLNLGRGEGAGSGRLKFDLGTVQSTVNVYGAGNPAEQGVPAVLLKGTHASNVLNVHRGSVGAAFFPGETGTVATARLGYQTSQQTDADVVLGDGCTLTTISQNGGKVVFGSNVTTLTQRGGEAEARGSCNVATYDGQDGALRFRSSGAVGGTALVLGGGCTLDLSGDPRGKTVSNLTMQAGSSFLDPDKTAAGTLNITLSECSLADVTLVLGSDLALTRA